MAVKKTATKPGKGKSTTGKSKTTKKSAPTTVGGRNYKITGPKY
jgi:hypothetical protein